MFKFIYGFYPLQYTSNYYFSHYLSILFHPELPFLIEVLLSLTLYTGVYNVYFFYIGKTMYKVFFFNYITYQMFELVTNCCMFFYIKIWL